MFSVTDEWNQDQKNLKQLFSGAGTLAAGIDLCKTMHAKLHQFSIQSIFSRLVDAMPEACFKYRIPAKFETIVWNIWHITRIEDAVAAIVIAKSRQIFDQAWMDKLGTSFTETGNSLTGEEAALLTKQINVPALLEYRQAVGKNTQAILDNLEISDLHRKPTIGLLLMPITRHQIVHINDCFKIKEKYRKLPQTSAPA